VDPLLASYFRNDYYRLSELERRVLLVIAERPGLSTGDVQARLPDADQARLPALLMELQDLGHLRPVAQGWHAGNAFWQRWLQENLNGLWIELDSPDGEPDEQHLEAIARMLGTSIDRVRAILDVRIRSAEEFFTVIRNFFIEIRHIVEQDEGYRLLLTTGENGVPSLRPEEEVQIALKHWLRPMCRALNIEMAREPLTGRGLLDFKFSIGHDLRCMVEVKLFNNRLQDGLGIQLPLYLMSDRAKYGIYVPIFLEATAYEEAIVSLKQVAAERATSHPIEIDVIDIRAWKPKSASKADGLEDAERYRVRTLPPPPESPPIDQPDSKK
jgi:hypothetical protein